MDSAVSAACPSQTLPIDYRVFVKLICLSVLMPVTKSHGQSAGRCGTAQSLEDGQSGGSGVQSPVTGLNTSDPQLGLTIRTVLLVRHC
jgi:hypothetical protein